MLCTRTVTTTTGNARQVEVKFPPQLCSMHYCQNLQPACCLVTLQQLLGLALYCLWLLCSYDVSFLPPAMTVLSSRVLQLQLGISSQLNSATCCCSGTPAFGDQACPADELLGSWFCRKCDSEQNVMTNGSKACCDGCGRIVDGECMGPMHDCCIGGVDVSGQVAELSRLCNLL